MRTLQFATLMCLVILSSACGPTWKTNLLVNSRKVALALNDPADLPAEPFNPELVPNFDAPKRIRPCCAFGMDLKAKLGPIPVIGYENGNILQADAVGPHGYDNANIALEHNGLVYTCRGGYIDIAHIRDNADRTLFLTMQIVRHLPDGGTVEMPEEGTLRRIIIKPLPKGMLGRHGRWNIAMRMAEWINFKMSVWHEIATWYGWESVKGFSERLSAFSPEDLYSNVLGQKLAVGMIYNNEADSRSQYDQNVNIWIQAALRRLGAVKLEDARLATKLVDGLWWDSTKSLPDFKLVLRRNLKTASPLSPWIVEDSLPQERITPLVTQMCAKQPPPLPLSYPEQIGDDKIESLLKIEFEFSGWIPDAFPVPAKKGVVFTQEEFPKILEDIHRQGEVELSPGFDDARGEVKKARPAVSFLFRNSR